MRAHLSGKTCLVWSSANFQQLWEFGITPPRLGWQFVFRNTHGTSCRLGESFPYCHDAVNLLHSSDGTTPGTRIAAILLCQSRPHIIATLLSEHVGYYLHTIQCTQLAVWQPDFPYFACYCAFEWLWKLFQTFMPDNYPQPHMTPSQLPSPTTRKDVYFATATLPKVWTDAYVAPVFKKGPRCMPENYRPVSLTCVPVKILEHIIAKHYRDHLERHGIPNSLNHGFRSKFSCETQLLLTLQDLLTFWDRKIQVDIAILDFSKAFDTVPHDHLLGKLQFYGMHGPLLDWTASLLKTQTQSVVADGKHSKPATVLSGVSQGTVLGPFYSYCI